MNHDRSNGMRPVATNRNYKDTLFRMIFKEPADLLDLYNAMNDTEYQDPHELQIVTLENAIYMNMKNDLAFIIDCRMNLYEQQASVNPNMPLRDLFYVAKEYQGMVSQRSLYSSQLVKLPTPYFVVFYNGTSRQYRFIMTGEVKDELTGKLQEAVEAGLCNEKWRSEYMKELLYEYDIREEGRAEVRAEERANMERERARADALEEKVRELEAIIKKMKMNE